MNGSIMTLLITRRQVCVKKSRKQLSSGIAKEKSEIYGLSPRRAKPFNLRLDFHDQLIENFNPENHSTTCNDKIYTEIAREKGKTR